MRGDTAAGSRHRSGDRVSDRLHAKKREQRRNVLAFEIARAALDLDTA
jgi:hypothetical protein